MEGERQYLYRAFIHHKPITQTPKEPIGKNNFELETESAWAKKGLVHAD